MPKFGKKSKEELRTCHPTLQKVMEEVVRHMDISVIKGYRGSAEQETAYRLGNSKKRYPHSKHNRLPSIGVDIIPYPCDYKDQRQFTFMAGYVLGIATAMGIKLRWGGDWDMDLQVADNSFNDLGHFEVEE